MAIIQLLFREFEEGKEFLALEDDEKSGLLPAVERLVRVLYPPKKYVSYVYSNLDVNNGITDNKVI